ncbi:glycosyltransferase family 4 protein [Pararhizobium haloflavum]|uniref:glycosyltransferase family 4 protein n=1 Tax=Pararhizobium haloflavum TaxID=2037914 RepID=UPI000C188816|nr:glycosyltransferase [Pararhizobium haloflavum]
MRIALVSPHPIPFGLGGAENLIWGLQDHINEATPHDCEIVGMVSPERNLDDVVASYEAFTKLDVSRYDCVITGKYPAWMIDHPNHIVYMLHRLRGLYDTYPFAAPQSGDFDGGEPAVRDFVATLRAIRAAGPPAKADIAATFDRYRSLRRSGVSEAAFAYPGPLAREIVHFLDDYGLDPRRIRRYAAIANTVRKRASYFPKDVPVDVLYPPANGKDFKCGGQDYFFTGSRLDGPKRVGLIIEAMKHVSADVPLLIAGTGPAETELRALAGDDPRIRFLGFVPDSKMPGLYADALAIPFVPYDEDYGLITIEAMKSGKPVVTTRDSGGPREFVEDGRTGFATAADPKALGERLQWLADEPAAARRMGEQARDRVAGISWDVVCRGLLGERRSVRARQRKAGKITVAATFPVYPPRGGGQLRVFHLYRHIAQGHDVDLVTLAPAGSTYQEIAIAPGMTEIRVPRSARHAAHERDLTLAMDRIPVGDVCASLLTALTPDYRAALAYSAHSSDAVIVCHPYLVEEIGKAAPNKPLWYEAQDVEQDLKAAAYAGAPAGAKLLEEVVRVEALAWREADLVFACAQRDLDRLGALYGPTRAELLEVANGVDLDDVVHTPPQDRRPLALGKARSALFIGSWHPPNIDAIERIIRVAPEFSDVLFLVAGTACGPFTGRELPANVELMGMVDHATRDALFARADLALNPMTQGSGTNLKMLDYFAAGIPVISTAFGTRGLALDPGRHLIVTPDDDFSAGISRALDMPQSDLAAMVVAARTLVEDRYSWESIADAFMKACDARFKAFKTQA